MPELRKDPIIGRWVIIATERAHRPGDFKFEGDKDEGLPPDMCPFCEGHEDQTPPEIIAARSPGSQPDGPGWLARIVPSVSGFLDSKGELDRHGKGIYDLMNGVGNHEVLVMTPAHTGRVHTIEKEHLETSIELLAQRLKQLSTDERLKYVLLFGNHGRDAGGSNLGHMHLQLIATPVTPKRVKEELAGAKWYYDYKERCIFCDMLKQEFQEDKRVISKIGGFAAIAPFCSRFPFEIWIMPVEHSCDFDKLTKEGVKGLARIYMDVFARMNALLGDFPFNAVLHTAPFRRRQKKGYWETIEHDYHWHIEIMPRITAVAGFEWGSGFYINIVPPEDACGALKGIKI